jgi:hypothetical protein
MRVQEERELREREPGPRRQHPAPALAIDHGDEREGEQRRQQPPARVDVGDAPEGERDRDRGRGAPAAQPARPLDGEEHEAQQERLERDLERDSPELEQPRCRARQDHGRDGDRTRAMSADTRASRAGARRRAHSRREPARDLAIGPGDDEDTRQPVHEERALVVPEGREVEREARAVLVTALRRDRVAL